MRRIGVAVVLLAVFACMSACGKEQVQLSVWGPESSRELVAEMTTTFQEAYADRAEITITYGVEDEDTLKETVVSNPNAVADVFVFPNDQLSELVAQGILLPITSNTESIIAANGGSSSAAVKSASAGDTLYAYPMTASNGYFMYYDKSFFTEEDVKSLDRMLQVADEHDKKLSMEWSSGWYLYSFFAGAGMELHMDESGQNVCNFNTTEGAYTGVDVMNAMLRIAEHPGFVNADNDKFVEGMCDGSIIAGVNGTWNAKTIEEALGENYAACKLPTYTLKDEQVQMKSFAGYKLVGVNAQTENPEWAMLFGEWVTNYDNQVLRFETIGEGPSNTAAGESEQVLKAPAIMALSHQAEFAVVQNVGDAYWQPMVVLGTVVASGNPDEMDLQKLLDDTVKEITAEPK